MEVASYDEVMEAAREFGTALANCEECQAVEKAQEALRKDVAARRLLSEYQSKQHLIQTEKMRGKGGEKDELDELKSLEEKIENNPHIKNLSEAQKNLQEMLTNLNAEISGLLGVDFAANSNTGCC